MPEHRDQSAPISMKKSLRLTHPVQRGVAEIEAEKTAEDAWVAHAGEVAAQFLCSQVDTWYLGANISGKPRVFMPYLGGAQLYRRFFVD